jgi:cysteine desulfurase family protein
MIYLDKAATSWPKPPAVVQAVCRALEAAGGNPGRTNHRLSFDAAQMIQECRENLARLFHIANPLRICFTANATEALNLALKGLLSPGNHVICSSMEHNSVWRPLVRLEEGGVEVSMATPGPCGTVSAAAVAAQLRNNTRLIAIVHASNVSGEITPVAEIGSLAHERGIPLLLDAAQTAGAIPINVETMHIDLLAFPGHKSLLGPQGTGGLYVSETVRLLALKEGGTGSDSSNQHQPDVLPDRFESGTLNTPGIAGLNQAALYLLGRGVEEVQQYEEQLTQRLVTGLAETGNVTVYGPTPGKTRAAVVSFNIGGMDSVRAAEELERRWDIACRPGLHCAPLAHRTLGTCKTGAVRFSPGPFTTTEEIDIAVRAVSELAEIG